MSEKEKSKNRQIIVPIDFVAKVALVFDQLGSVVLRRATPIRQFGLLIE